MMRENQDKRLNDKKDLYKKMKFKFDKDGEAANEIHNARRKQIFKECKDMRHENQRMKAIVREDLREFNQKRNLMQRTEKEVA